MGKILEQERTVHGHRVRFLQAGAGPPIVLIHGITSSADTWVPAMAAAAGDRTLIAPDLLGHGGSAKPRGDYSLGAFASGVRDLLAALGHDRVTVVGHSLGGGIAMQFAYQFPERTERLVLVSSGGLGREVNLLLRAAALPGASRAAASSSPRWLGRAAGGVGWAGSRLGPAARAHDLGEIVPAASSRSATASRGPRSCTRLRAVIEPGGQRVSGHDRLYLAAGLPTLIVWGEHDPIIPVAHGSAAHAAMPGSRLEIFPGARALPAHGRSACASSSCCARSSRRPSPAMLDAETLRDQLRAGAPPAA